MEAVSTDALDGSSARGGDPTFALALGGGGARGLAHIHVAEAFDDLGIRPAAVAGSSIGAVIGAGIAAGMSGRAIHEHALRVLTRRGEVAARIWRTRPANLAEMWGNGVRLGQFDVERIVRAFMPDELPARFEDLALPLRVTTTDYFDHRQVVLESGDLHRALAASAAIPAIFRPVHVDGRLMVDGGIVNPVPFDLVCDSADIVIAIDVVGAPKARAGAPSTLELILGASQIMMQSIIALKLQARQPAMLLRPPVSHIGVLDFLKAGRILRDTVAFRDEVKRAVDEATARWHGSR